MLGVPLEESLAGIEGSDCEFSRSFLGMLLGEQQSFGIRIGSVDVVMLTDTVILSLKWWLIPHYSFTQKYR